jgi:hypothetical protein
MTKPLILTEAELNKFRALLDSDPTTFKELTGKGKAGRPQGSVKPKPQVGQVIEQVEDLPTETISVKEATKMTKQKRAPRVMSEEAKERMKDVLAQGREVLRQKREAEKEIKQAEKERLLAEIKAEEEKKKKQELAAQGKYVKKYVIVDEEKEKPIKQRRPRTARKRREDIGEETEPETNTESEMSEATIMKKIEKKRAIIETIDKMAGSSSAPNRFDPFSRKR